MPKTDSTTTETRVARLRRLRGETAVLPDAQDADDDHGDDDTGLDRQLVEELVADPQVWKELGVSSMAGWRWTNDPALNFPPAIKIRGRNFRSRRMLEAFKKTLIRKALTDRAGRAA